MRDYECQHEPLNRGVYASESQKSHCCEQCGSTETPERDETRGEICCPSCGLVLEQKLYDLLHPKTHANTPENNSGRGTLEPSKSFGIRDHYGTLIPKENRRKMQRLGKINRSTILAAENTNKSVEESIEALKKFNHTLSHAKEKEYRKLLMETLNTPEGDKLFKTGSKYNATACALVLHSNIDRRIFHERLRKYAKANHLSKSVKKSIRKRGLEIREILSCKKGVSSHQLTPVYPHKIDVNSRPSEIYQQFIGHWWGQKIHLVRTYSKSPKYFEIIRLINTILDNPKILDLNGGEMLEPILDACLLVSMLKNSPSRKSGEVMEKLSLTPKSRIYIVRLKRFVHEN